MEKVRENARRAAYGAVQVTRVSPLTVHRAEITGPTQRESGRARHSVLMPAGPAGLGWGQSSHRAGIPWQGLEIAAMDDHSQPGQAFMSALVTEHLVLQSARSTTVSEAVGRSAVYLTVVSSAMVAFGFFAAATHTLAPVVATVLPALIILGVFTFVRLVET